MATLYQMVKENAEERKDLTNRQDADVKLRDLVAYIMYKADGKTKVEGVINRTLNRPKVMFNFIVSALGKATEQILVETEEKNLDLDYIKDFRRLYFAAADARLRRQGERGLNPYFIEQTCLRGGISVLSLCQVENGVLNPRITLWDYRYVNYEKGEEGLGWASYGYGTKAKKANIEREKWWDKRMSGVTFPGKEAEVVDIWDDEHNEIWLQGKEVFEQEHSYKWQDGTRFVPAVIEPVSLGSMIADTGDIKNQSPSVFFLIESAIPELNRMASIIVTLAMGKLKPPMTISTVEGKTVEPDAMLKYDEFAAPGSLTSAKGEILNLGDANRAVLMAAEIANKSMDEGGFIPRQLEPPQAGIALILEKEGQDVIHLPRLNNISSAKQSLGDMFTAQVQQIGGTVRIGTPGHKREFQTKKLEGQYEVTHKFSVRSLAIDAGLASLAAAYGSSMSEHTKRRDIFGMDDPDGEERWLSYEEAGRLVPAIKLSRLAEDLIALEKDEEAEMIADFAGVQLEQLLGGNAEMPKAEKGKEAKQVVSLFGGGAGRGGRPQPPQEPPTAEEI